MKNNRNSERAAINPLIRVKPAVKKEIMRLQLEISYEMHINLDQGDIVEQAVVFFAAHRPKPAK